MDERERPYARNLSGRHLLTSAADDRSVLGESYGAYLVVNSS